MERMRRATSVIALLLCIAGLSVAQRTIRAGAIDENFDSPTPILLSQQDSTRALANTTGDSSRSSRRLTPDSFRLGSKIELFVSDLALLPKEAETSLRVYATDKRGNIYRFPVLALREAGTNVWGLTTLLRDEIGFYDPPEADGDVLIYVTWRGLASNTVRLGLGRSGGPIKEDPASKPTPLGSTNRALNAPTALPVGRQADRLRFQEQAAFGPTPALSAQLDRVRLAAWIRGQFSAPYPSTPYPAQPLKPINQPADCDGDQVTVPDVPVTCQRDTYSMYPVQTWNAQEMLYGSNQLRHKMAWALSQIWVTSGVDIQQSRHMVEYHKILSNNAFGNYRTLMRQMTLSPTMGEYLSMNLSTRTAPNENYAREIMQLFSVGLFMLNPDGTRQVDGNGNPIPSYDQNTVNNLTRVFTGWNFCSSTAAGACPNLVTGTQNFIDPMMLNVNVTTLANNRHDLNAKTLLVYPGSTNVPACPVLPNPGACNATPAATGLANINTYAYVSLDQALDNIFYHPNLGPYISKILIQQFVTSDPTPAYVGRVAAAFNDNGLGVRGDMKAVISAILLDPEARGNVKTDPNYGKLREPVQFATNILRSFNVRNAAGTGPSDGVLTVGEYTGMQQVPLRSPTVFNYYPPDFVIPGTALLGPEFALMTTGTTVQRLNFVNRMVFSVPAIGVSSPNFPGGTSLDFSDLLALSTADTTGNTLVDELDRRMMHGTMSPAMKSTILTALNPTLATDMARVRQAVYLIATSSQYQVQR